VAGTSAGQGVDKLTGPPRPRPPVHAAEFCQHEAESRAELKQRSGQDIVSARRARARGRTGARSHSIPQPATPSRTLPRLPSPQIQEKTRAVRESSEGQGRGLPGQLGKGLRSPCGLHLSPPRSSAQLQGSAAAAPPARALGAGAAHSSAGAEAPGRSPSWRGRGGAAQLRQQPREGILGSGSAPSRAHGAGPRAARVTAASAGAERLPRVGGRAQRRESRASAPAPSPQASGPPPLPLFAQEMGEAKMLSAMLA
jgi:hypothetical protein